ncbi:DUF6612 family protein [Bacillus xiapuensis]|uniref:DUF6612 family protein n=1 Tax=Bacillus xiapuensis TaxID=2014075 RepID=UPI000C23D823|nr:DUF6612 family protein [Bacillus xiapuensis]
MKNWMKWMTAGVLTLGLAACNETAKPTPETPKEETSEMTLGEVFNKAMETSKETKSMSADIDMLQTVDYPKENIKLNTATDMKMDLTIDPLALYQTGTMKLEGDGAEAGKPMNIESYMTENGFYMKDPEKGQWIKMPQEMYGQIMKFSKQQADPKEQLKQLAQFKDDFTFEQTKDDYVLKLNAKGDKFNQLIESQMSQMTQGAQGKEAEAMMKEMMKGMKVENSIYTIYLDKKTFQTKKMDVEMDMTMDMEGNQMKTSQTMSALYSNFNQVKPITVPEEVVKNAQEIQLPPAGNSPAPSSKQ